MSSVNNQAQWIRTATLVVYQGEQGLDLSQMHFKFRVLQNDLNSPNNAEIVVYNLQQSTANLIQAEYSQVTLSVGYQDGSSGVIFQGNIKQFKKGRERNVDNYLTILAADGDIQHNFGIVNTNLPAGSTPQQQIEAAAAAAGMGVGYMPGTVSGGALIRGKVLHAMPRAILRDVTKSQQMSWSIQNGELVVIPLTGYLPDEAVVLNSLTGMIGIPEQTDNGITVRSLLNPKLKIGGQLQINNKQINQTVGAAGVNANLGSGQLAFNSYFGVQQLANVTADGIYRIFVVEHTGDTRGTEWYSDITCLSLTPTNSAQLTCAAYG